MKKILFGLVAMLCLSFNAFSQDEPKGKMNVLIDYFDRPESVSFKYAETARNAVMEGLHKSGRVTLIDVDTQDILRIEEGRRMEGVSTGGDMERIALMEQQGANLLIQGRVNDVAITESVTTDSKGKESKTYKAVFSITLKVINPKDGTVMTTETIKVPNSVLGVGLDKSILISAHSEDEAVTEYAKMIPGALKKFVKAAFPIVGNVLEASETKGDEIKAFYCDLGSDHGAAKGQKYDLREIKQIGSKTSRKVIGEAEIADVEGEDISLVKVKKGGKELKASLDAGNKVILVSKE